jgi:c-di-GMP-binding flagellar brake protein YcgR
LEGVHFRIIMSRNMTAEQYKSGGRNLGGTVERRGNSRFPVKEDVRYRVLQSKAVQVSGSGKTLDMSSGGILFTTSERLQPGRLVEIAVNWPARLHGTCPLQLVATGRVVRSDDDTAAVRIERYEFRTRSSGAAAAGV